MSVERYRKKPKSGGDDDQFAARYEPGQPLGDLRAVAQMASSDGEVAEVTMPSGQTVLLVRWTSYPDDHPSRTQWQVVESGQWLAYSGAADGFLYDTTDGDWRQWYERVG
jgi:hypothetical protein